MSASLVEHYQRQARWRRWSEALAVRGVEKEGRQLDSLHRIVEGATIGVLVLAFAAFLLSVTRI
jgi:hypothetical protein